MHSFVDMMDDIVWTENDIINRTETMIRRVFSTDAENILTRKTSAAMMGQYQLSEFEQWEIQQYAAVCAEAQIAGRWAREDMAMLQKALDYEQAQRILDNRPQHSGNRIAWAEATIAAGDADPAVISLVGERARFKALNS